MLTKIGKQILDELKSELDADLDDKKLTFVLSDGRSLFNAVFYWVDKFIFGLCLITAFLIFITLFMADATTLEGIKNASVQEWMQARSLVLYIITFGASLTVMLRIAVRFTRYKTAKERYSEENDKHMTDTKFQIELIEEVLYRHNLINKKDN